MPLPKRPSVTSRSADRDAPRPVKTDDRFANIETDPKFRLPSRKHARTKLDPRFSRLRTDPDFNNKAAVDRYGRRLEPGKSQKVVDRLFDIEVEQIEEDLQAEGIAKQDKTDSQRLSKARQQGLDPIRDGGLSSSSDESSSDEEEDEVENQAELATEEAEIPTGEVTSRLAAVNMDWDNVRASDILAVARSFLASEGRILNVTVYPSEFGLERMQKEEIEGPPRHIFASATNDNNLDASAGDPETSGSEDKSHEKAVLLESKDGEEFDSKALRNYQLDRLRYYYAVITCSSPSAAKSIYDTLDGREYLSSANFFDLRFVPDEVDFDADPHDRCEELPNGYKPNEFVTGALSHSKVGLTWDADDTTRKEVQKRAFSRKEIDENELQAYLGVNSSSSEDDENTAQTDKAASLRAALGLNAADGKRRTKPKTASKRDRDFQRPNNEMEVTFTSGLSANGTKSSVFENEPEETTLERYVRKEKERKAKKKERRAASKPDQESAATDTADKIGTPPGEDDPWNDPFFGSDGEVNKAAKEKPTKAQRKAAREEREKQKKSSTAERANLELLMADEGGPQIQHFDMNEIIKAQKSKRKSKKGKKGLPEAPTDDFEMDTSDPRFSKLFESHEFAIDPTNPRFKNTTGMKALLEAGRSKRKRDTDEEPVQSAKKTATRGTESDDLTKLAARVRAKSKAS